MVRRDPGGERAGANAQSRPNNDGLDSIPRWAMLFLDSNQRHLPPPLLLIPSLPPTLLIDLPRGRALGPLSANNPERESLDLPHEAGRLVDTPY